MEMQNQEQQQQSQSQMQPQQGERSEEQQDSQGPADGAEPDWEVWSCLPSSDANLLSQV